MTTRTAMEDQGSEKPCSLSPSGSQGAARFDPEILYAKRKESTLGVDEWVGIVSLITHPKNAWISFGGNQEKSLYPRF